MNANIKKRVSVSLSCVLLSLLLLLSACQTSTQGSSSDVSFSKTAIESIKIDSSKPVYVIGHKSPDTDTVDTAIVFANLLKELGINAEARVSGKINNETKFVLEQAGVQTPEVLENAQDQQIIMVDHSKYTQAVSGMDKANIVAIFEHHALGDVQTTVVPVVDTRPYGCASTIAYDYYQDSKVNISQEMAKLMLSAIMSDTVNLTAATTTEADKYAYNKLLSISGISDANAYYEQMSDAKCSLEGMTDEEIFKSDYKDFETNGHKYGFASIQTKDSSSIADLSQRMLKYAESIYQTSDNEFYIIMITDSTANKTYIYGYGNGVDEILKSAYPDNIQSDGSVVLDGITSRKAVTPKIDSLLK